MATCRRRSSAIWCGVVNVQRSEKKTLPCYFCWCARFLSSLRRGDQTPYGIKTLRKRETRDEIDAKKFLNHVLLIVCRTLFRLRRMSFLRFFFFSSSQFFIRLVYRWPCTATVCARIQRIPCRRRRRNLINFQFFIRRRERERRKEKKWFDSQGIYSCTYRKITLSRRCRRYIVRFYADHFFFLLCSGFFTLLSCFISVTFRDIEMML